MSALADPDRLLLLLGLIAALGPFIGLTVVAIRQPPLGIVLLLATEGLSYLIAMPEVAAGPMDLTPRDVVFIILGLATVVRSRWVRPQQLTLLVVGAVVALGIVRSLATFGVGGADMEFRPETWFIVAALYGSTFSTAEVRETLWRVFQLGLAMSGVAIVQWLVNADSLTPGPLVDSITADRPIVAAQAVLIAHTTVMGLWLWLQRHPGRWVIWATAGSLVLVVLTRHRSVWVATVVMLGLTFLLVSGTNGRRVAIVGVSFAAALVFMVGNLALIGDVDDTLSTAATDLTNWEWRQDRWGQIWDEHAARGPVASVFGSEYGYPWLTTPDGGRGVSPHNLYIRIMVRLGLVGAVALFGTYLWFVGRHLRVRSVPSHGQILAILLVGHLVYYVPYGTTPVLGLVLGAAAAWDHQVRRRNRTRSDALDGELVRRPTVAAYTPRTDR
ncbi:MAG: hypothetical protein U5K29_02445 [Acidimicrobiales bacterium]|nr:hypothetical protein [Acidimicrobiales bacterium]